MNKTDNQALLEKMYEGDFRHRQQKLEYLTAKEKRLLFDAIYAEEGIHRKRNIAIFEVALYCALRVSEITLLDISSYDPISHNIYCYRLKGSNANTLRIVNRRVIKALDDYLEERLKAPFKTSALFISQKGTPVSRQRLDALMKHYCRNASYIHPDKWHMHVLKHTRAVDLAEMGLDVDDIQFWLGHRNVANTFIYLSYTVSMRKKLFDTLQAFEDAAEMQSLAEAASEK